MALAGQVPEDAEDEEAAAADFDLASMTLRSVFALELQRFPEEVNEISKSIALRVWNHFENRTFIVASVHGSRSAPLLILWFLGTTAINEMNIENELKRIEAAWRALNLDMGIYKGEGGLFPSVLANGFMGIFESQVIVVTSYAAMRS